MPRQPKFDYKKTPDGWRVNVPKSVSASGEREQHFFASRDKAKAAAEAFREKYQKAGTRAALIKASVAEDAMAAVAILAPWKVSLLEAARFYDDERKRMGESKLVSAAAVDWIASCEGGLRDRTLGGYKQTQKRLDALSDKLLASVTADELQAAVCPLGSTGAAAAGHYRNARAFWRWAAKKGWCKADVFSRVEPPRVKKDGEIAILTPAEAESLLRVAEAHYPQAVASYALQLFAGIRAEEITRLEKEHVTSDGIELAASVTKKGRRRHITPSKTLAAWLAKYPFAPCPNWRRVDMACRRLAGWAVESELLNEKVSAGTLDMLPKITRGAWPQNVLRHSHASYAVATGTPLETLLFEFGHTGSANVLRAHYVGRASKKAALQFLAIRPKGAKAAKPPIEAVA